MTLPPTAEPAAPRTVEGVLYDAANFQYDDFSDEDRIERPAGRALSIGPGVATGSLFGAFALGVLTTVVVLALRDRLAD